MLPDFKYLKVDAPDMAVMTLRVTDVPAWFELIDTNRQHLVKFGNTTGACYPTPNTLAQSFEDPHNARLMRMGMWANSTLVGYISALSLAEHKAELGYYVGEEFEGKGFTSGAVGVLSAYLFSQGFTELSAQVHEDNTRSRRVLEKNGFKVFPHRNEKDVIIYVKPKLIQPYDSSSVRLKSVSSFGLAI